MVTSAENHSKLLQLIPQLSRYALMSGASALVTLGLPLLLHEVVGINEEVAVLTALATAFAMNFVTLRTYVFASGSAPAGQLAKFTLASAAFRAGEYGVFLLGHTFLGLHYIPTLVATLGLSIALKFCVYRAYVFAEKLAAT